MFDIRVKYTYNNTMTVREILKVLHDDGWKECDQHGSHIQLKHDTKKGKVTIPNHKGDLAKKTVHSIYRQAGIDK
jgi:predicted RNA binding protein YcfA (HicA-like mRNA interferase family)